MQSFLKKCSPNHIIIICDTLENTMKLHDVIKDNMNNVTISTPSAMGSVYLSQDQAKMKIVLPSAITHGWNSRSLMNSVKLHTLTLTWQQMIYTGMLQAKKIEVSRSHLANLILLGKIDMPPIRSKHINDRSREACL